MLKSNKFVNNPFIKELSHARNVLREKGWLEGSREIGSNRWVSFKESSKNLRLLRPHEIFLWLGVIRASLFFVFYILALPSCLVGSGVLLFTGHPGWAAAALGFALYSVQGIPVMLGQTLVYAAGLPKKETIEKRKQEKAEKNSQQNPS